MAKEFISNLFESEVNQSDFFFSDEVFLVAIDFGFVLFFGRLTWIWDNAYVTPEISTGIDPFDFDFLQLSSAL